MATGSITGFGLANPGSMRGATGGVVCETAFWGLAVSVTGSSVGLLKLVGGAVKRGLGMVFEPSASLAVLDL